jgi:hypothetical protein
LYNMLMISPEEMNFREQVRRVPQRAIRGAMDSAGVEYAGDFGPEHYAALKERNLGLVYDFEPENRHQGPLFSHAAFSLDRLEVPRAYEYRMGDITRQPDQDAWELALAQAMAASQAHVLHVTGYNKPAAARPSEDVSVLVGPDSPIVAMYEADMWQASIAAIGHEVVNEWDAVPLVRDMFGEDSVPVLGERDYRLLGRAIASTPVHLAHMPPEDPYRA